MTSIDPVVCSSASTLTYGNRLTRVRRAPVVSDVTSTSHSVGVNRPNDWCSPIVALVPRRGSVASLRRRSVHRTSMHARATGSAIRVEGPPPTRHHLDPRTRTSTARQKEMLDGREHSAGMMKYGCRGSIYEFIASNRGWSFRALSMKDGMSRSSMV